MLPVAFVSSESECSAHLRVIRNNDVAADQTSTDTAEFGELVGPVVTCLDGILVVLHNGSSSFAAAGCRTHAMAGQAFPVRALSGGTKSLFVPGSAPLPGYTAHPGDDELALTGAALGGAGWSAPMAAALERSSREARAGPSSR